jgi:hypothetical protein
MKVLVVGNGGREHALAWKLARSPRVKEVLVAPGNAGTAREPRVRNVAVEATDIEGLLNLAWDQRVDLTVIGPEARRFESLYERFSRTASHPDSRLPEFYEPRRGAQARRALSHPHRHQGRRTRRRQGRHHCAHA